MKKELNEERHNVPEYDYLGCLDFDYPNLEPALCLIKNLFLLCFICF